MKGCTLVVGGGTLGLEIGELFVVLAGRYKYGLVS